jgi:hypothetical protein
MVVKLKTSNLKTLELDLILWFELAQIQESIKIQEPTNIRLDYCEGGYLFLCSVLIGYQTGFMHICPLGTTFSKIQIPLLPDNFLKLTLSLILELIILNFQIFITRPQSRRITM